jgi:hypothetical protein
MDRGAAAGGDLDARQGLLLLHAAPSAPQPDPAGAACDSRGGVQLRGRRGRLTGPADRLTDSANRGSRQGRGVGWRGRKEGVRGEAGIVPVGRSRVPRLPCNGGAWPDRACPGPSLPPRARDERTSAGSGGDQGGPIERIRDHLLRDDSSDAPAGLWPAGAVLSCGLPRRRSGQAVLSGPARNVSLELVGSLFAEAV